MLSESEKLRVLKLAEELTGASQSIENRMSSVYLNIARRMEENQCRTLDAYIELIQKDKQEKANLVSSLTIHTTMWFREGPHFVMFHEYLLKALERREPVRVWSAACSTGEEAYSFALILEEFRNVYPTFEYQVLGTDIDHISIEAAKRAIYPQKGVNLNLHRYQHHLLIGSGETDGLFTLAKEIRNRCQFKSHDLRYALDVQDGKFDLIICRNVLIYFSMDQVKNTVGHLLKSLKPDGALMLGHSELIDIKGLDIEAKGHSVYRFKSSAKEAVKSFEVSPPSADAHKRSSRLDLEMPISQEIRLPRILAVDDMKAAREIVGRSFRNMGFHCDTVETVEEATKAFQAAHYDIVTLDLQMPGMEQGEWLKRFRQEGHETPVVIVSDVRREDAKVLVDILGGLAQYYIEKSALIHGDKEVRETLLYLQQHETRGKFSKASKDNRESAFVTKGGQFSPRLIAVGSSTGGPQALSRLLESFIPNSPPILITQHIIAKFSPALAERLEVVSGLKLGNMVDGEPLKHGHIYMALDDYHIGVELDRASSPILKISDELPVNRHRPSVDFLFNSIAQRSISAIGIILTGMGRDGAQGLLKLRQSGSYCLAQAESDCTVFGMPKEAIKLGAADFVGTVNEIRDNVNSIIEIGGSQAKKPLATG